MAGLWWASVLLLIAMHVQMRRLHGSFLCVCVHRNIWIENTCEGECGLWVHMWPWHGHFHEHAWPLMLEAKTPGEWQCANLSLRSTWWQKSSSCLKHHIFYFIGAKCLETPYAREDESLLSLGEPQRGATLLSPILLQWKDSSWWDRHSSSCQWGFWVLQQHAVIQGAVQSRCWFEVAGLEQRHPNLSPIWGEQALSALFFMQELVCETMKRKEITSLGWSLKVCLLWCCLPASAVSLEACQAGHWGLQGEIFIWDCTCLIALHLVHSSVEMSLQLHSRRTTLVTHN